MAIARTTGALIGTNETTGVTIANNATVYTSGGSVSTDVDLLGDAISVADIWLYVVWLTGPANSGTLDITISSHRVTGQPYAKSNADVQIPVTIAAGYIPLGKRPCNRFLAVSAFNNNSTGSILNVSVLYELEVLR